MKSVVVDYGVGNLGAIVNMIRRAGGDAIIARAPEEIAKAQSLVLPGVGRFDAARQAMADWGQESVLRHLVTEQRIPTLGICLGLQLMAESSQEGALSGLGWLTDSTIRFPTGIPNSNQPLRLPHIGWNPIRATHGGGRLMAGLDQARFYFLHSYHLADATAAHVTATCDYGHVFPAVIERGNLFGTQFHPEKSHDAGLRLFRNFLAVSHD